MKFKPIAVVIAILSLVSCSSDDRYVSYSGYAQGGTWKVTVNRKGVSVKDEVIKATIDSLLIEIDNTFSGYNKSSLVSRLNSGETIEPNDMFRDLYSRSYGWFLQSDGAVDVAAGPLFDIWGFGFKEGKFPSDSLVEATMATCGFKMLKPSVPEGSISAADLLLEPGESQPVLNFNAVAQGYTSDVVANYLHSLGIHDMLVDIGEIFCEGLNPRRVQWNIGVDRPVDGNDTPGADMQAIHVCTTSPQGVVTSGNYRKFYVVDGRKYAHTVDTRTGRPVSHNLLSATVIAPDSATADAAATWCMVIGLDAAKEIVAREGYEAYLIYEEDGEMREWHSDGFELRQF